MKRIVVTHFSGQLGYQLSRHFFGKDVFIDGVDQFLPGGFQQAPTESASYQSWLDRQTPGYMHYALDISDRDAVMDLIQEIRPSVIIHSLPDPGSTDSDHPLAGTQNLLEAAREFCWLSPFVFLSSNQISGANRDAVRASDLLVQEFGRKFDLPTCCLRGPVPTDPWNPDVALYDPLAALVKTSIQGDAYPATAQEMTRVREAIHARDVASFIELFWQQSRVGEVYHFGAGKENIYCLQEVLPLIEEKTGKPARITISDNTKSEGLVGFLNDSPRIQDHYPAWRLDYSIDRIIDELVEATAAARS